MIKRIHSPNAILQIFTSLCLSQVKEQLIDNLACSTSNPESFVLNGNLFVFSHNKSFIVDESLKYYGCGLEVCNGLNWTHQ